MSGCVFSVLLQKVKIKIQNELTVHPSASLSINEDVKINFKQSNQCFNALKCQKCRKTFAILTRSRSAIFDERKFENNYEKKVLQNGYKYPKNKKKVLQSVIELIYNFTNAYCEILCLKNGRCHFNEIDQKTLAILTRSAIFNEIGRFDEIGHYIRRSSRSAINFTQEQSTLQTIKKLIKSILNSQIGARMH